LSGVEPATPVCSKVSASVKADTDEITNKVTSEIASNNLFTGTGHDVPRAELSKKAALWCDAITSGAAYGGGIAPTY
jgi:hypothetical protein